MYTVSGWDSCKFFKALEKARMFWYNPNILPNQAGRTLNRQATLKRVAGRSEVGAIGLELITRRSLVRIQAPQSKALTGAFFCCSTRLNLRKGESITASRHLRMMGRYTWLAQGTIVRFSRSAGSPNRVNVSNRSRC